MDKNFNLINYLSMFLYMLHWCKNPWRWSSEDWNMLDFWCVISENVLILTYSAFVGITWW